MNVVVRWSVVLAALVTLVNLVVLLTGLHANPLSGLVFIVVAILLNVAAIFLALRETAGENPYGRQLANGALIGLMGGILIFLASWMLLGFVFPDSMDQMREGYREFLEAAPLTEEERQQQMAAMEAATPVSQSIPGLIGTFFTSLIAAAIVAIFQRRKR